MKSLKIYRPFPLECGTVLPELELGYHVYGTLNADRNNVIWIGHAFTANSDVADWWSGLVGHGKLFDPSQYFIVCANMLGSCYGATNANSINPETRLPYGKNFPIITIKDIVNSHEVLRKELNINTIHLGIGGSMGGQQILEWSVLKPFLFESICIIAANAKQSPWATAINEAQRMALKADPTLYLHTPKAGKLGLEAARAMALLSYRNSDTYNKTQQDDSEALTGFKATTYQQYQGQKLSQRFTALSYLSVLYSMDSHNIGRQRGGIAKALSSVRSRALIVGIQSDILFPIDEQIDLAEHIPNATLKVIDSPYGHDGFLIESKQLEGLLKQFMEAQKCVYC
jgi:homoserine O-acetyltransferase/O-succinyltransferase